MKTDRYKKVSPKWWIDTTTGKWIHDDRIDRVLLGVPKSGSNLPAAYKQKRKRF